jgi:hypothetical protein
MEELLRAHLRELMAVFHAKIGVTPKTVCKRALNDNTFYDRVVERGQGFTVGTYDRVVGWLWSNWPQGADWPSHVPPPDLPSVSSPSSSSLPAAASSVC